MDNNFWFYTLSAIPQTLGALIALAATFIIFKLNHIETRTKEEHSEITTWLMPLFPEIEPDQLTKFDDSEILVKLREGINKLDRGKETLGVDGNTYNNLYDLYKELVIYFRKRRFEPTPQRIYDYLVEKERILSSLLTVRKNALKYLSRCLALTVIPIVGSILILPFRGQFSIFCAYVLVVIMVLFAVAAVSYTAYCVKRIATPQLR